MRDTFRSYRCSRDPSDGVTPLVGDVESVPYRGHWRPGWPLEDPPWTILPPCVGTNQAQQPAFYSKIFIDTLVRLWKRQIVLYKENNVLGSIPQHVKNAVFKRDSGKCVQCGYDGEYIEYDHIIPRSKSGPNTVENVQLLCRKCNLQKGNR